jgi:hypothetical protein
MEYSEHKSGEKGRVNRRYVLWQRRLFLCSRHYSSRPYLLSSLSHHSLASWKLGLMHKWWATFGCTSIHTITFKANQVAGFVAKLSVQQQSQVAKEGFAASRLSLVESSAADLPVYKRTRLMINDIVLYSRLRAFCSNLVLLRSV